MNPEEMMKNMHKMMPEMMDNCMSSFGEEDRKNMLTFCRGMLDDMEEKHLYKNK